MQSNQSYRTSRSMTKIEIVAKGIRDLSLTPFQWGVNDCCLAAANFKLTTTGVDYAKDLRGKYASPLGAYRLLKKLGGMEKILTDANFIKVPLPYAIRGDVVIFIDERKVMTMGICNGIQSIFAGGATRDTLTCHVAYREKN